MAEVTVKYKGADIAQLTTTCQKTLETSGVYCEEDIIIDYKPRSKSYEITLEKSSGWVLLTTLDTDVLEHIDDANLIVSLKMHEEYAYVFYAGNTYIAGNTPIGYSGTYPVYGMASRTHSETATTVNHVYYPANKKDESISLGGVGMFRLDGDKYYVRPGDGFVYPGTYRLTFTW